MCEVIRRQVQDIIGRLEFDPNPNWRRAVEEMVALIADEKTRSYNIGLADQKGHDLHAAAMAAVRDSRR